MQKQINIQNKKAKFEYSFIQKYTAGIVLTGAEVKSLRINTGSIRGSYIIEERGELWLSNSYIKKHLLIKKLVLDICNKANSL